MIGKSMYVYDTPAATNEWTSLANRLAHKLTSLKSKARAQRRLDLASRSRTRKRRAELALRHNRG